MKINLFAMEEYINECRIVGETVLLIFIIFKLTNVINWPWILVLSPALITPIYAILTLYLILLFKKKYIKDE